MIEELTLNNNQDVVETTPIIDQVIEKPRDELAEVKEQNWRMIRQQAEQERERRMQLEQEMAEIRRSMNAKPEPDDLDSDDLADKRHLKKYRDESRAETDRLRKKTQELEETIQKISIESVRNEVFAKYQDYATVVNDNTLEQLKIKEPEIFETIMENKNPRARLIAAYKNIKAHINTKSYDAQDAKIAENKTKPRSVATVATQDATTPLSTFSESGRWKLSPEEAKALREDTARCARNR